MQYHVKKFRAFSPTLENSLLVNQFDRNLITYALCTHHLKKLTCKKTQNEKKK